MRGKREMGEEKGIGGSDLKERKQWWWEVVMIKGIEII